MSKIIAIDFDGCLVTNKFPEIGEEIKETVNAYRQEAAAGSKFILWTCRTGEHLQAAVDWCTDRGILFEAVNENAKINILEFGEDTRKVLADEYWDDRAVRMPESGYSSASSACSEQKRLAEIDAISGLFSNALVNEAKYGAKACSAQELAYRAAMTEGNLYGENYQKMMAARAAIKQLLGNSEKK